jgi:hypothetical protein
MNRERGVKRTQFPKTTEQEHETDSSNTGYALWKSVKILMLLTSNHALNKPQRKQYRKRILCIRNRLDGL